MSGVHKVDVDAIERAAQRVARYFNRGGHGIDGKKIKEALEGEGLADTREVRRAVMNRAQDMNWGQQNFLGG